MKEMTDSFRREKQSPNFLDSLQAIPTLLYRSSRFADSTAFSGSTPEVPNFQISFYDYFKSLRTLDTQKSKIEQCEIMPLEYDPEYPEHSFCGMMHKGSRSNFAELRRDGYNFSLSHDNYSASSKFPSFHESFDLLEDSFNSEGSSCTDALNSADFEGDASVLFNRQEDYLSVDHSVCSNESASFEYLYEQLETPLTYNDQILIKTVIKEMESLLKPRISRLQRIVRKYERLKEIYEIPDDEDLETIDPVDDATLWRVPYNEVIDQVVSSKAANSKCHYLFTDDCSGNMSSFYSKKRKISKTTESPFCERLFRCYSLASVDAATANTSSSMSLTSFDSHNLEMTAKVCPEHTRSQICTKKYNKEEQSSPAKTHAFQDMEKDGSTYSGGEQDDEGFIRQLEALNVAISTPKKQPKSGLISIPSSPPLSAKVIRKFIPQNQERQEENASELATVSLSGISRNSKKDSQEGNGAHEMFLDVVDLPDSGKYASLTTAYLERNCSLELIRDLFDDNENDNNGNKNTDDDDNDNTKNDNE